MFPSPLKMEMRARLAALEQQINVIQAELLNSPATKTENPDEDLRTILIRLKREHQAVLENIERALKLVDSPTATTRSQFLHSPSSPLSSASSPISSPRLRDRISAALTNGAENSSPLTSIRPYKYTSTPALGSSPLRPPVVDKSHITFEILNDLENQQNHQNLATGSPLMAGNSIGRKRVHFAPEAANGNDEMSTASREYLRKYGLL